MDKWLKDRRGRALSFDDENHYRRISVALQETIRLIGEIDQAIAGSNDFLSVRDKRPTARILEDRIAELFADVPEAEWDRLPHDLIDRLDHHLYGTEER